MNPLFFSQTTNFEAIENLITALQSDIDDCTAADLLEKVSLFATEFLYKQERIPLSPTEWHAIKRCHLAFENFKFGLETHAIYHSLLRISQLASNRFNTILQTEDIFKSSFKEESEQLLSLTVNMAAWALEESPAENQALCNRYCQSLNALYGPFDLDENIDIDEEAVIWGFEDYIAIHANSNHASSNHVSSSLDNKIATFHLLCLKLYNHYQYVYDLQNLYRQFEALLDGSASLAPYIKLKLSEIIAIHLKFDSQEEEYFTNKQRKIWLSLSLASPAITDSNLKLRINYLLAKSYMQTKCIHLRNCFMAKKNWEEILKNAPPDSPYLAEAHFHLSFLHIFGVGKKFEINLSKGLAHLAQALEHPGLTKNLAARIESLKALLEDLHADEAFAFEITNEEVLNRKEAFQDALYAFLQSAPAQTEERFNQIQSNAQPDVHMEQPKTTQSTEALESSEVPEATVIVRNYLRQLHSPSGAQFIAGSGHLLHSYQFEQSSKKAWLNFWLNFVSEFACSTVKNSREALKHLDEGTESSSLLEMLAIYGPDKLSETLIGLLISFGDSYEVSLESEIITIAMVNTFNACINELQKIAQGNSPYATHVSAQANTLLYRMRTYFIDRFEAKNVKTYQTAFINNLNASKLALLNVRRYSLSPINQIDAICECYSTINFLHKCNEDKRSCSNSVLAWLGEKYNLEKSLEQDTYNTFVNAVCTYYIAASASGPERKLEILKDFQKHLKLSSAKQFCLDVCKNLKSSSNHPEAFQKQFNPIIAEFLGHFIELLKYEGVENIQEIYALVRKDVGQFMVYQFLGYTTQVYIPSVKCEVLKHSRHEQKALLKALQPEMPAFFLDEPVLNSPRKTNTRSKEGIHPRALPSIALHESKSPPLFSAKETENFTPDSSKPESYTQESKKLALLIEQQRIKKQQIKSQRQPASRKTVCPSPVKTKIEKIQIAPTRPSICISAKALATYEKIFTPQNSSQQVAKCSSFDANDFRIDRTDIKREDVALLIEELGGKYIKAQGKGSHAKCTLAALEENADIVVLNGEQMPFANLDPFEMAASHPTGKETQMILTKSPYLKPYQIRQLCKKLIALGLTPDVVKRKT